MGNGYAAIDLVHRSTRWRAPWRCVKWALMLPAGGVDQRRAIIPAGGEDGDVRAAMDRSHAAIVLPRPSVLLRKLRHLEAAPWMTGGLCLVGIGYTPVCGS